MARLRSSGPEILDFKRRQSSGFFDDSSVLMYLSARVRSCGMGKSFDGFAHWSSLSSTITPCFPLTSMYVSVSPNLLYLFDVGSLGTDEPPP